MRRRTLMSGISVIVKSLLHFDTTTITKDEVSGNTWTYSRVSRNTSNKKFGNSSVGYTGSNAGAYIQSTNLVLDPDKDFTIDFWFRPYSTSSSARVIFDLYDSTNTDKYIILDFTSNSLRIRNKSIIYSSDGSESISYSLSTSNFEYIAIYYDSNTKTVCFRVNNNISSSISVPNIDFEDFTIRLFSTIDGGTVLKAYIDEFRIREGIADPTEAIPTEAGTV